MIRKLIYDGICEQLKCIPEVKHIDLWNQNVQFIEQESPWQRPAIFVEFLPIKWGANVPARSYHARVKIILHVVQDWQGDASPDSEFREDNLSSFTLCEQLHKALSGLCGAGYQNFDLEESYSNHNHEDIIDSMEVYACDAFRLF